MADMKVPAMAPSPIDNPQMLALSGGEVGAGGPGGPGDHRSRVLQQDRLGRAVRARCWSPEGRGHRQGREDQRYR